MPGSGASPSCAGCGELRHAERYGWLSLTGWLLGMKVRGRQAGPHVGGHPHRAGGTDVLGDPLADDPAPGAHHGPRHGPRRERPAGPLRLRPYSSWRRSALRDGMVEVGGRPVGGGAIAESLRARLEEVAGG